MEQAYMKDKEIKQLLVGAVKSLLEERPDDPKKWLADFFGKEGNMGYGNSEAAPVEEAPATAMIFPSGMQECCATNPEIYTVVADIPGCARLVQMVCPPGGEDKPHEHPSHSLYFVTDAKLELREVKDGKLGDPHEAAPPAGAAPIFPPGGHQVKNIGDKEARVIFVEAYPESKPSGDVTEQFVSPFETCGDCYKVLAENDDWYTGILEMAPGAMDTLHNHRDHLIYVLEGEEVTIYPDGNMDDPHAVPIKPYAGIPAPVMAGPIFSNHLLKNSGSVALKMVFFERKK